MRRIAKMPLWAESRIHGDVYVRFGGRLLETYRRKVTRRRLPSLQITNQKVKDDFDKLSLKTNAKYHLPTPPMPPTNLHIKSQSSPKKQACTKEATYLNGKVSPNKQACTAEATYLNGKVSPKKQACTKEATYLNGQSSPNKQAYTEDILAIDHLPTDKPLPLRYYRRGRRVTKSFR